MFHTCVLSFETDNNCVLSFETYKSVLVIFFSLICVGVILPDNKQVVRDIERRRVLIGSILNYKEL